MFIVVSVTLLGLWAARALRTPLSGFAEAAESFSLDDKVAALPERGPEEIRAVAKAFNRMRERIRTLVDDRTRMLAAMGHDLRTPITRLRLRSEFIGDGELRREMLRDLDQMRPHDRKRRVVPARWPATGPPQLMSMSRPACKRSATSSPIWAIASTISARAISRSWPAPTNCTAPSAIWSTTPSGTASVTLIRLTATPASVTIDVEDDGPGIVDAQKAAVIEPFIRGDEARTMNEASGFGLGLTIARAVAEAHERNPDAARPRPARTDRPHYAAGLGRHPPPRRGALTAPPPSIH